MQHDTIFDPVTLVTPTAEMSAAVQGGRAKCLQRLIRLEMPVPTTVSLSFEAVHGIAEGRPPAMGDILLPFDQQALLSVRPSSQDPDWGGPSAVLNIGLNNDRYSNLIETVGEESASKLYQRFIGAYSVQVDRLDVTDLGTSLPATREGVAAALAAYEEETENPFPQARADQLLNILRSMARAWEGTTARLLREGKGAPADAGLGLVVQEMALGIGADVSGSGVIQFIDGGTGEPQIIGRFLSQSQGREALTQTDAMFLTKDPRGPALEELCPEVFAQLLQIGDLCRLRLREEMQVEFALDQSRLRILDAVRVPRSSRATVRTAVQLAEDGVISRDDAVLRVAPVQLNELLHSQIDPWADRDVLGHGIAASPGAASGRLVFTAAAAQAFASRGEPAILVRRETAPEDIRGMHAAQGVLTLRGGTTSHAAVIARGLGLPCVVGANDLTVSTRKKVLTTTDGRRISEGEEITLDGSSGDILFGSVPMIPASMDRYFQLLLSWADESRDIAVRANADTPSDAKVAARFSAEGIGLCRTEHMFFDRDRLTVMREMIFAETPEDRRSALELLLPMQRADFIELFEIMAGKPVTIRLLDPPLHEFLPTDRDGQRDLAGSLDLPLSEVTSRIEQLSEYNPMLGLRGVRLGITVPEIYDMQARAIFEAAVAAAQTTDEIKPEIMIPLVSARREVELVRTRIDATAAAVRAETGQDFDYSLGVMVETPRAALRAGDIAQTAAFLSFGTNDLTQMAYGLSRDDAGKFMPQYIAAGAFPEDPFHTLDDEGVGELLEIAATRGRAARPNVVLSICGEHGASMAAIDFARRTGFDYVSCSPFRVPVARLSAAHLALRARPNA